MVSGKKEKVRQTHREKHTCTEIHAHTQSDCMGEKLLWSLLAEGRVVRNFSMFLCVMCYLNSYTILLREPSIKI